MFFYSINLNIGNFFSKPKIFLKMNWITLLDNLLTKGAIFKNWWEQIQFMYTLAFWGNSANTIHVQFTCNTYTIHLPAPLLQMLYKYSIKPTSVNLGKCTQGPCQLAVHLPPQFNACVFCLIQHLSDHSFDINHRYSDRFYGNKGQSEINYNSRHFIQMWIPLYNWWNVW